MPPILSQSPSSIPARRAAVDAAARQEIDADPGFLEIEERLGPGAGLPTAVWILAISALAARLAIVLISGDWGSAAAGEYGSLAASVVQGSGFAINEAASYTQNGIYEPSSLRPPTYPLLLAGLYWLMGVKSALAHMAALLLNAIAGAAMVPLAYQMARQAGGQHPVALLAAFLLAAWPTQLVAVAFVQPMTLVTLALMGSVLLWYRSLESRRLGSWLAFGLVTALAVLTEPVLLPLLALAPIALLLRRELPWPIRWRNLVVLAAMTVLVIGPWTYRNWRVHSALVPVTSTFWMNMWMGNNPNATGTDRLVLTASHLEQFRATGSHPLRQTDLLTDAQRQELDGRRAMEREAVWKRYATAFIGRNTAAYVQLCQIRLARTVWADWDNPRSRDPLFLYFASRTLLLVGTLVGLFLASWNRWKIGWPALILATCVLVHTLTLTSARAAVPLEALQIPLVALALFSIWQAVVARHQRPPIVRRFMGEINDGTTAGSLAGKAAS
jgi:4-amino-4-deoxy-L-arabinose transferase-like glycosyltransferase